jgi:hypothetical protein
MTAKVECCSILPTQVVVHLFFFPRQAFTRCVLGEAQIRDLHEGNMFTGPFFTISGVMIRTMKTAQDTLPTSFLM